MVWMPFIRRKQAPFVESYDNLESVKELFMIKVPSILRCLLIGSWVGLVRLSHDVR